MAIVESIIFILKKLNKNIVFGGKRHYEIIIIMLVVFGCCI